MFLRATQSVKFKRLQRFLCLPHYAAVGVLECLWHIACREAPSGDIGRLSNEDIASLMEWRGDADELIEALVRAGWLDASDTCRLAVHDWKVHCPSWVKSANVRTGRGFTGECTQEHNGVQTQEHNGVQEPEPNTLTLTLTPTLPSPSEKGKRHKPPRRYSTGFERFWEAYPRPVGKGRAAEAWSKLSTEDRVRAVEGARAQSVPGGQLDVAIRRKANGESVVPYPATWLNQRRFDDEVEIQQSPVTPAELRLSERRGRQKRLREAAEAADAAEEAGKLPAWGGDDG